jgi:hypothetical protein
MASESSAKNGGHAALVRPSGALLKKNDGEQTFYAISPAFRSWNNTQFQHHLSLQLRVEGSASMSTESSGCQSRAKQIASVPTQGTNSDISKRKHLIRSIAGLQCGLLHIWNLPICCPPIYRFLNLNPHYHNRLDIASIALEFFAWSEELSCNFEKLLSLVFRPQKEQQLHRQYSQKLALVLLISSISAPSTSSIPFRLFLITQKTIALQKPC